MNRDYMVSMMEHYLFGMTISECERLHMQHMNEVRNSVFDILLLERNRCIVKESSFINNVSKMEKTFGCG